MYLKVENLKFGFFTSKIVLDDISFESDVNKTIAIVGASGSGKSTILRLLCGIIHKQKGNVLREGTIKIDNFSASEFTQQGKVGFMFQDATLFPNLTVKENIELPLKFKKVKDNESVIELIEKLGLQEYANYLPAQLSGGMKTRTALARTFVTKPNLILLDEPFSALDIRWKFLLYRELEILKQSYLTTSIIVTHDISEALLLSNHIIVLGRSGKILKEILIKRSLPRVFETDAIKQVQEEYLEIQDLIMND